jgi:pimeloyl-ACP methyl ester carboxylesterase
MLRKNFLCGQLRISYLDNEHILEMERRRVNTKAVIIENASHGVNHDKPNEFFVQAMNFIKE